MYELTIAKENMKFSSAHFTLFPDRIERLHGHNYRLYLHVRGPRLHAGLLVDFALLKQEARRLCDTLDEHCLLPGAHPDVTIHHEGDALEVRCRDKRYVLPRDDCRVLPIENVSCECLAAWFCGSLVERLRDALRGAGARTLVAVVEESPGQSGRCEESLEIVTTRPAS